MPSPTTATLTGPTSGNGGFLSTPFTVTLDHPADPGGVTVTPASSVGGDTLTPSSFNIASGTTTGTFQLTPSTCSNRNISITTSPVLTYAGSPITYNSLCNCPDDAGANTHTVFWDAPSVTCPMSLSIGVSFTPSALFEKQFYCTTSVISMTITE